MWLCSTEPICSVPNHFLDRHGSGVILEDNDTVVTSIAVDDAMAYTALPIPLGTLYQLKVLKPGIIVSQYIYAMDMTLFLQ